eukprot:TRINITY_DN1435_c0_g2_i1.p1 TRINITY_DN1435_c0_g2~~TRINITY_DN1435_c0_g2_i1.p1  ORF type:complete len:347 (-),score=44.73 TRINITY_DN1435_c0_g2_i1:62-1102(-)
MSAFALASSERQGQTLQGQFRAVHGHPRRMLSYAEPLHHREPLRGELPPKMACTEKLATGFTAGVAMALSARTWRLKRHCQSKVVMVKSPPETFQSMVEKGESNAKMSVLKTLHASIMGGCYVGMSGLLSLVIAGNMMPGNLTAQTVIFASLFPINLLLVLQSGGQLFTGNTAAMSMALYEDKVTLRQVLKNWFVSYAGNVIGCCLLAFVARYVGLLSAGTTEMAVRIAMKKCSATFGVTLVKGVMCNWLVCMAVWLATSAQDLTSKMVGIWFPISMFIMIGFEHSVANMFMLPAGILSGAPLSLADVLFKNLLPVTVGNAIAGAGVIGAGFSFSFGKLGAGHREP